jgi:DNA-binding response OmpR family regulator
MGARARILVVDDDRLTVMMISNVLEEYGYEVFTAYDGMAGLEKAREVKPHLIILDIIMPEIDGYQVARRLKRDPETANIAVLILSAKGGIDEDVKKAYEFATRVHDRLEGFDSGAVDFLTKPVKAKDVAKRVKALLWASGLH